MPAIVRMVMTMPRLGSMCGEALKQRPTGLLGIAMDAQRQRRAWQSPGWSARRHLRRRREIRRAGIPRLAKTPMTVNVRDG